MIVQPPEHVALFYHCHASQCVCQHTQTTHLITDKAGGHIPDDEHKSNKHTQEEAFIRLCINTLNREHWCGDIWQKDVPAVTFL